MKKVLVIMATYNGEKYLEEQLYSILNQKNVEVSILIHDDGSKDKTLNILNKYQSRNLVQWYTGKHLGVAKGYFDLIKKAVNYEVDYIAFSYQDDIWDIDKLDIACQKLSEFNNEKPALYYCGQRLVDEKLNLIAKHELNKKRTLKTRFILSDFAGCTGVFNIPLAKEVVKFEPEYMLMHDTWILKVCLCLGGNVYVDYMPHMNYRQHDGNTVGLGRSLFAYLKQIDQYLNKYHVEAQMNELLNGYGNKMLPEYKALAEQVCNYKESYKMKKKLLNKKYINFYNKGLNLIYALKILLNKL